MAITLYQASIGTFIARIKILQKYLAKGAAKDASLVSTTLIADMKPLIFQIQRLSDSAKGTGVRIGGAENVRFPDEEKTFDDLFARLEKTLDFLEKIDPESFVGKDDAEVVFKATYSEGETKYTGTSYVLTFAVPSFYFHEAMVYALLRKEGVEVGKKDWLGPATPTW